jgi:hypothetical protein
MSSQEKVLTRSAQDIIGTKAASKAIEEIFNVIHPAPPKTALRDIFNAESATQYLQRLANFTALLADSDSHAQALKKLDEAIAAAEKTRDEVLGQLYDKVRPVERSYRMLQLFFENAEVRDTVQRPPVEFYLFNADTKVIASDVDSSTIVALDEFIKSRNDTFNFRQFICNLVVPGYVPDVVRKRLEDIASAWGMLLIGDLKDEPNFRALSDQFRTDGGAYEFLKRPEDKAASDVVIAGHVKLRDRHWFEKPEADASVDDADLYGPASMLFAGALARTDRTSGGGIAQGPVGMIFGKVRGAEKARIEPRISQMEHLSMERQVIRFFTSYRAIRYVERRIAVYLRRVAEQRLTRDLVKEQVRDPIQDFLEKEKEKGTLFSFDLDIDMDEDKFAQGVLDMKLEVLPVGPAETFKLKIDTPNFSKGGGDKEKK